MKNLHLFPNEKFTEPYIEFINKNFDSKEHLFLIMGKGIGAHITPRANVKTMSKDCKSVVLFLKEMYSCDKIFLHGLFDRKIVLMLFFHSWLLKKCNWVVWGGDLYHYENRKRTFKSDVYEKFRGLVIKNMGSLVTLTRGDYELAQKWYKAKGKYYHGIYINPLKLEYLDTVNSIELDDKKTINIQIGNSADPSNNHIEVLNLLRKKYETENIKIYVPLSYGDKEHAKKVQSYGEEIYGEKFVPMFNFLSPKEYSGFLASIDIAIFANERQQALGNIYALIYLGKKIYIRNDISTWDYIYNQLDIDIFNYLDIGKANFDEFKFFNNLEKNRKNIMKIVDNNEIKKTWNIIFRNEGC